MGVNVAGYFDSPLGVGEAARQVRWALETAGAQTAVHRLRGGGPGPHAGADAAARGPYPVNLICANAEAMPAVFDELGLELLEGRRTIALWWWELSEFPARWARSFDHVDEIWVGSRFVADALAPVSPVPVVRVPLPVARPSPEPVDRGELGLPECFLFLYVFDYASTFERKNPLAAVEAFGRAFPDGAQANLIIKCLGAERFPRQHGRLLAAAEQRPGVNVISAELSPRAKDSLIAACDCYLSLHRSEGFGLTIAEAVLLERPVIATAYSGPLDFLSPESSYLVDFTMVPVGEGSDPYPADALWAEPDVDHAARLMREVLERPEEGHDRAALARESFEREHSPPAAGRAMLSRLATLQGLPNGGRGLAMEALERRIWSEAPPAPSLGGARAIVRRALLRALRPHTVQQRLVNEEVLRALRTLDERVQGLATAQSSLQAELRTVHDQSSRERPDPELPS